MTRICGTCAETVRANGGEPQDMTPRMVRIVASTAGADFPDHTCESREKPWQECGCSCTRSPARPTPAASRR